MEGGPPGFPRGFTCPAVLWIQTASLLFRIRGSHPLWPAFPCRSPKLLHRCAGPQPQRINPLVWPLPRSLATTSGISVDFSSSPYLDVSVQAVPPVYLLIQYTVTEYCSAGLLHSEICGSMCICHSPQLIAAYHVFRRLLVPRHSPCALYSLTLNRCEIFFWFSFLTSFGNCSFYTLI